MKITIPTMTKRIVILLLLFFFSDHKGFEFRYIGLATTVGLLLVAALDLMLPEKNYLSETGAHFLVFSLTISLSIVITLFSWLEQKLNVKLTVLSLSRFFPKNGRKVLRVLLIW